MRRTYIEERPDWQGRPNLGDINGDYFVLAVEFVPDGHDCNKDICRRCAYPDDEFHITWMLLAGNDVLRDALIADAAAATELSRAKRARDAAARDLEHARFCADHQLITWSNRSLTLAFQKLAGRPVEDGDMLVHDGLIFERSGDDRKWFIWDTSSLVRQRGDWYRPLAA